MLSSVNIYWNNSREFRPVLYVKKKILITENKKQFGAREIEIRLTSDFIKFLLSEALPCWGFVAGHCTVQGDGVSGGSSDNGEDVAQCL